MHCVAKGTSTHPILRAQVVKAVLGPQDTSSGKPLRRISRGGAEQGEVQGLGDVPTRHWAEERR